MPTPVIALAPRVMAVVLPMPTRKLSGINTVGTAELLSAVLYTTPIWPLVVMVALLTCTVSVLSALAPTFRLPAMLRKLLISLRVPYRETLLPLPALRVLPPTEVVKLEPAQLRLAPAWALKVSCRAVVSEPAARFSSTFDCAPALTSICCGRLRFRNSALPELSIARSAMLRVALSLIVRRSVWLPVRV